MTVEEPPVAEDGAADSGAEGDQEGVGGTASGALPAFGEQSGVGVIEDGDRLLKPKEIGPDQPDDAWESAWKIENGPAVGLNQAWRSESDTGWGLVGGLRDALERVADVVAPPGIAGVLGWNMGLVEDLAFAGDSERLDVRASQVES
jgi:hypothetical protein